MSHSVVDSTLNIDTQGPCPLFIQVIINPNKFLKGFCRCNLNSKSDIKINYVGFTQSGKPCKSRQFSAAGHKEERRNTKHEKDLVCHCWLETGKDQTEMMLTTSRS